MEVEAAFQLWSRWEEIGFRYTTLLSDGDSKTFLHLTKGKNKKGTDTEIRTEKCLNHVSKRLETALRKCVKDWKVKGRKIAW